MESRIDDLEVRLTYQESTIETLNEVVTRQQNQIDALRAELESLRGQIKSQGELISPLSEETPPPHY